MSLTALLLTAIVGAVAPQGAAASAQRELAATLAAADSIDSVVAHDRVITFRIELADTPLAVAVHTSPSGEVLAVAVSDASGDEPGAGRLSWLADELADRVPITRLVVRRDGAVAITTADDRSYLALAGAPRDGNAAARARWAAAWD